MTRHARLQAVIALLVISAAACSSTGRSEPSGPPAGVPTPTAPPTGTPTPWMPAGLEHRPALPALVDGEVDACLPLCARGHADAGPFEVGVRYQTKWFFGGYMTITPARPLAGGEDSTGELGVYLPGDLEYGLKFHVDLYPVVDERRVDGVPLTTEALIDWLRSHEDLVVSGPEPASIGALPAVAVDVRLARGAPEQFPDCGAPCVDFLGFEQFDHAAIGIRGSDLYRLYLADVQYGGSSHVLIAHIESRGLADLASVQDAFEEILASVTVPASVRGG
jgi:hypothetical protein